MGESGAVLVSGGTGLVGGRLLPALRREGHPVRALSRRPEAAREKLPEGVEPVGWDGLHVAPGALAGARGIVHLAGEPIFAGRLTSARRRRVRESRIDSTRSMVDALTALPVGERPSVLVCASAVGYYGSRGEERLEEDAAPGSGFLAELCRDWEAAAAEAAQHGVRAVSLRIGVVLAREGGALPLMAAPFRLGLGGRLGSGRQWFPWIHVDDLVGLILAALRDDGFEGPVNAVAPEPVRNAHLTRALAKTLGRWAPFVAPAFVLRAALGELSGELLDSRRAVPARALARGFEFAHPRVESALSSELG